MGNNLHDTDNNSKSESSSPELAYITAGAIAGGLLGLAHCLFSPMPNPASFLFNVAEFSIGGIVAMSAVVGWKHMIFNSRSVDFTSFPGKKPAIFEPDYNQLEEQFWRLNNEVTPDSAYVNAVTKLEREGMSGLPLLEFLYTRFSGPGTERGYSSAQGTGANLETELFELYQREIPSALPSQQEQLDTALWLDKELRNWKRAEAEGQGEMYADKLRSNFWHGSYLDVPDSGSAEIFLDAVLEQVTGTKMRRDYVSGD